MSNSRRKLSEILFTPMFSDKEGKRIISNYLKIILYVTIFLFPGLAIFKILYFSVLYPIDYILFILTLFFIFLLYLVNKGKVVAATSMFILAAWVALTFMAAFSDGIKDIAVVAYIVVIFLATLLVGYRYALVVTILSIISVWVMGFIPPANGFMPAGDIPLVMSIDYTVLFILVITSIILFSKSYQYSYDRISRELHDRVEAEKKLSRSEVSLKEKNEELNLSNLRMQRINEELLAAKEKAEESDRLKTAFIQNISHEIRTPMNGIVGFLDLLQQPEAGTDKKREYIKIINSCTQQLAMLVNDLIDISKIESGTIDLHNSESDAEQILMDITNTFYSSANEKGLTFITSNDIGNSVIKTDHGKIKQILYNLVSNAVKFTQKGNITIKIARDKENILITVSDTGIGIDESHKTIIFERFRQAEIGLNRTYGGSGLGLAISKGNAEFLGGKIWVESKPGEGSVFNVLIPVEFLSGSRTSGKDSPVIPISRKVRILVAEDEEINYLYIKALLSSSNIDIVWAQNGSEAVEIFRKDKGFNIILMDLKMPVMNGLEATKRIKEISPDIPVIAVTAFSDQEVAGMEPVVKFSGYIVKPIEKAALIMKISSALN